MNRSRAVDVFGTRVRVAAPEDVLLLQAGSLDLDLLAREAAEIEIELPPALRAKT